MNEQCIQRSFFEVLRRLMNLSLREAIGKYGHEKTDANCVEQDTLAFLSQQIIKVYRFVV